MIKILQNLILRYFISFLYWNVQRHWTHIVITLATFSTISTSLCAGKNQIHLNVVVDLLTGRSPPSSHVSDVVHAVDHYEVVFCEALKGLLNSGQHVPYRSLVWLIQCNWEPTFASSLAARIITNFVRVFVLQVWKLWWCLYYLFNNHHNTYPDLCMYREE